jgi:vaccinia related kinase
VDTYEYIHSKAYVHADVKASNLALEYLTNPRKKNAQQIYLLDYGLSLKCVDANGVHMLYEPDARKAHNGTLEYASR